MNWRLGVPQTGRTAVLLAVGVGMALVLGLAVLGAGMIGGGSLLFAAGQGCPSGGTTGKAATTITAAQPAASVAGPGSIPAHYPRPHQQAGRAYRVAWGDPAGVGAAAARGRPVASAARRDGVNVRHLPRCSAGMDLE